MNEEQVCENCGRWIDETEVRYVMHIQIMAEPGPVIRLEPPLSAEELQREIEEQLRRMEAMDPEEVSEAEDQVHESYEFQLCPECRSLIHRRLKRRSNILDPEG